MAIAVRRFALHEWRLYRELRLRALADSPDAFGSKTPTVAHLFQVWVSPEARGQGIGRLLLTAVLAWAEAFGVRTVRLGVTSSHPAAVQLYRHAGFVDAGEPEPLRPGSPVFCQPMQLVLEGGSK